jgi:type I restriction enzyme S subunit
MSKHNDHTLVPKLRFQEFVGDGAWDYQNGDELFEPIANKNHSSNLPILAITQEQGAIPRELIDYHVSVTDKSVESYKVVEIGDFIISLRSFQGGIEYSYYHGLCSPAYIILRKKIKLENDFYRHYFKSVPFIRDLNKNLEGIRDGKMISYKQFSEILLPIPSPQEQQKIAACLSSLDTLISAESQKLELLKTHKKGLLQNLFPQAGESVPRLRFEEFLGSGDWESDTLTNLARFRRGSFPQPYGLPKWYDDKLGMPFIQVFDVGEEFSLKAKTKNKISSLAADQSVFVSKGSLIVTIQGTIGRVAITQYDAYVDRTLLIFEDFFKDTDMSFFAYIVFLIFEIEKQKAPGGIIKTITKEVLGNFIVKVPSKPEQQKIASCLSSLDDLISAQGKKLEALKRHKQGLLQGLFPLSEL